MAVVKIESRVAAKTPITNDATPAMDLLATAVHRYDVTLPLLTFRRLIHAAMQKDGEDVERQDGADHNHEGPFDKVKEVVHQNLSISSRKTMPSGETIQPNTVLMSSTRNDPIRSIGIKYKSAKNSRSNSNHSPSSLSLSCL